MAPAMAPTMAPQFPERDAPYFRAPADCRANSTHSPRNAAPRKIKYMFRGMDVPGVIKSQIQRMAIMSQLAGSPKMCVENAMIRMRKIIVEMEGVMSGRE